MDNFILTIRMSGVTQPITETVTARHQSEAKAKAKGMYKNCNIVSCRKK